MSVKTRCYDEDFKREAVRLVALEGRSIRDVERSLGITIGVLKGWIKSPRYMQASPASGACLSEDANRIKRLEKELAQVRMERDILKKAVAIFSTDPHRYSGL